jgi:hypothetical protein
MPERTLAARVENHEERLALLEALPARVTGVELQIRQLRTEMGEQFSAIRQELRVEIKAEGEVVRSELRRQIRDGDEETRRYMRVLHEEVLARIATIQEGLSRRHKR